jgi:hypothetical protein
MLRDGSDPFPPDPNAPRRGIVRTGSDRFPLDPNAPRRGPDRAMSSTTADLLERELTQLHLIGPAAGAELRRMVHGDRYHTEASTSADASQPRRSGRRGLPAVAAALVTLIAAVLALATPAIADAREGDSLGHAPVGP